ncbi:glycosyltransferase family 2 protein [Proteinivorax hydrogeniformans]|uniref:Glycosyltransferase family 2 protein n=1 Tax=Proteinivorax hydrogeniformans TaxID=1826727 RepID=A0AAU8HRU1_9FIRM
MVTVLVPAFNEEKTIKETILGLKSIEYVEKICVVDDGSSDGTYKEAHKANPDILISNGKNQGKGGALNELLQYAKDNPYIAMVDADLGESSKELQKLIIPVKSGECEMAIASFPTGQKKGGLGVTQKVAQKGLKLATGLSLLFPLSGQRVMTKEVFQLCTPFAKGFGVEMAMNKAAAKQGFKILEIETQMTHRYTENDLRGYFHRGKQCYSIIRQLVR